jgi:hypothetical protein
MAIIHNDDFEPEDGGFYVTILFIALIVSAVGCVS